MVDFGDTHRIVAAAEAMAQAIGPRRRSALSAGGLLGPGALGLTDGPPQPHRECSRLARRSRQTIRALFRGLARLESAPATAEEEIAHDAVRLDGMGARGVARAVMEGRREGLSFLEVAAAIEEAARSPLRTQKGEALAAERRRTMLDFARRLASEEEEFGPAPLSS